MGTARCRTVVDVVPQMTAWIPKMTIMAPAATADVVIARTRWVTVSISRPARISVASA